MAKNINQSLNILKCVAAFGVIYLHSDVFMGIPSSILFAIFRFTVPVFFLISGFYSFYIDNDVAMHKYGTRIKRLFKLEVLSFLLYFLVINKDWFWITHINRDMIINLSTMSYKYLIFCFFPSFAGHLWFIHALLYCYIFLWCLTKFKINPNILYKYVPILLIINIVLGEFSYFTGINVPGEIYFSNFLFTGLPFFMIGYFIHDKQEIITKSFSNKLLYFSWILICCFTIMELIVVGQIPVFMGTIFLSISLFIWCVKNPNKLNLKLTAWIGGNLYGHIYILHMMVLTFILNYIKDFGYLKPVIVFILTTIISFIVYIFIKRIKNLKKNSTMKV